MLYFGEQIGTAWNPRSTSRSTPSRARASHRQLAGAISGRGPRRARVRCYHPRPLHAEAGRRPPRTRSDRPRDAGGVEPEANREGRRPARAGADGRRPGALSETGRGGADSGMSARASRLITAGDVAGALEAALETRSGIHCMMGSGGATEGVLAPAPSRQLVAICRPSLVPRRRARKPLPRRKGRAEQGSHLDDLARQRHLFRRHGHHVGPSMLKGVRYEDVYAYTQSMVLRSASGTMRIVDAYHRSTN